MPNPDDMPVQPIPKRLKELFTPKAPPPDIERLIERWKEEVEKEPA